MEQNAQTKKLDMSTKKYVITSMNGKKLENINLIIMRKK